MQACNPSLTRFSLRHHVRGGGRLRDEPKVRLRSRLDITCLNLSNQSAKTVRRVNGWKRTNNGVTTAKCFRLALLYRTLRSAPLLNPPVLQASVYSTDARLRHFYSFGLITWQKHGPLPDL